MHYDTIQRQDPEVYGAMLRELLAGTGAVRATLKKYLNH